MVELRQRHLTTAGRANAREPVGVEHTPAHSGRWRGDRARSWGVRRILFELRRCAAVHTLHVLARWDEAANVA